MLLIERFDPSSAIEAVERHGVTMMSGPPTMWAALASLPGVTASSFASVRSRCRARPSSPPRSSARSRRASGLQLSEGYGLTETSPVVTSAAGTDAPIGSIGPAVPGVELRLVDADGEDVLVGDSGEIWVRGPNVFPGYWNDPEATAAALTPDGWLRTGDIAVVDDDGYVYLVDRAKDLIIVSGFNVFPAEVEDVLVDASRRWPRPPWSGCPTRTPARRSRPTSCSRPGTSADEDDIISYCADRLARYKCPSKVMFVDELPHNVTGKLLRRALR